MNTSVLEMGIMIGPSLLFSSGSSGIVHRPLSGTFPLMTKTLSILTLFLGLPIAFAQTPVDLSGTVYDQDSKPRPGVIVRVSGADLADTTDAAGQWSIQGLMVAVRPKMAHSNDLRWLGRSLVTQFEVPTLISADLFDASGRRLALLPSRIVLPGVQSIGSPAKSVDHTETAG